VDAGHFLSSLDYAHAMQSTRITASFKMRVIAIGADYQTVSTLLNTKLKIFEIKIDILTKEDLEEFKKVILSEIKLLLKPEVSAQKEWLRSLEVRKILKISPGTLQNLRINGHLAYTKVGSIFYYAYSDIQKMLEKGGRNG